MVADVGCGMSCGRESMNKTARSEAMALERRRPIFIFLADAANWSTRESSQLLTKSEVRGERRQASKQTRSCAHCSLVSGQRVQGGTCASAQNTPDLGGLHRYAAPLARYATLTDAGTGWKKNQRGTLWKRTG